MTRCVVAVLAALTVAVSVAACSTPAGPPPHPLGAGCTWPADADAQRDRLAVLSAGNELVLLASDTGAVVARCTGVRSDTPNPEFTAAGYLNDPLSPGTVVLSPVSPDLRQAVVDGGVVELSSGRVIADPDPTWPAAALPGGGAVLRERRSATGEPVHAQDWCLAPRPDAPQAECRPLAGDGDGVPVAHGDGTVGWAVGNPVPADFGGLRGVVQTDGRGIVQARLDNATRADGTSTIVDGSQQAGVFDPYEVRFAVSAPEDLIDRPTWFTLTGTGPDGAVRAALHTSPRTWREITGPPESTESLVGPYGAAVLDGGRFVVLAFRASVFDVPGGALEARFVIVGEDGSVREAARLQVRPDGAIADVPRILAWPDSAGSATA